MATTEKATAPAGVKRKASTAGLTGSSRPVKRRASKACHCCRSRKVRCDVVESGIPCTNCRLDEVECVVTEGKRRKKSYIESDVLNPSPIESVEAREEVQKFPLFDDMDGLHDFTLPAKRAGGEPDTSQPFDYEWQQHRPHLIYQTQGQRRLSPEERSKRMSALGQLPRLSTTPVHLPPHLQCPPPTPPRVEIRLPNYIAPLPPHILGEDLEYLQRKGAFQLPDPSIRNEFLRSYVQYVHPYLPLLDLQDFLSAVEQNRAEDTVSLLLFHAVMFAASAYIDMRYLTAQGYSSRKMARKAYFLRVKLLYDLDWEVERVTVVQSVLLMTYWYESPNDPKDVSYWLGIAISIARTIGMNYNTEGTDVLSPQKRRLWKRIWWCAYMRDRVIAIGLRRPIRIRDEEYDVPMPDLADFETDPLPPELCRMLGGCSAVRDGSKRATLASMFVALVEVCRLITDVLAVQYSALSHKIGVTNETTVRLVPKANGADPAEVARCTGELDRWYAALPLELRYFRHESRERTNNHDGEVIMVHRALLTAIYLTTSSALHRPQMMPAMPDLVVDPGLKELSQRRVHDAALDITEIYRDMHAHDIIRYLPNTGVTVLLPAIIMHLMDIKSLEGEQKQASTRHFHFCMQVLQKLRDLYSSADFAFAFLDAAMKNSTESVHEPKAATTAAGRLRHPETAGPAALNWGAPDSTLTPPPDAGDGVGTYVDASTLARSHFGSLDAMTPPSAGSVPTLQLNSGISLSLKDLEAFIGLDDGHRDDPALALLVPGALDHLGTAPDPSPQPSEFYTAFSANASATNHVQTNTFDALINLEAGSDLFAPTQVSIDDSLFKDIDMEWLADSNDDDDDEPESATSSTENGVATDLPNKDGMFRKHAQLETPPDSTPVSRATGASVDRDVKEASPASSHVEFEADPIRDATQEALKASSPPPFPDIDSAADMITFDDAHATINV